MTLSKEYYSIYFIIIVLIGLFILYRAYKKGLFFQVLDVVAALGIMYYSSTICSDLANTYPIYKESEILMQVVNPILWFFICYVMFRFIYYFIEFVLRKIFKNKKLKFIDHFLGLIAGLFKVLIIYCIICVLCMTPLIKNGSDFIESTPLEYIEEFLPWKGVESNG